MPFAFDFNKLDTIREKEITVYGYVSPLIVEYGLAKVRNCDKYPSVCWRIKSTEHTFTSLLPIINKYENGNYELYFSAILKAFREDYLSWEKDEKYKDIEWFREYKRMFGKIIIK